MTPSFGLWDSVIVLIASDVLAVGGKTLILIRNHILGRLLMVLGDLAVD